MSTPIVSVDRMGQLELGAFYEVCGAIPGQADIVPQVFRLEKIDRTQTSGNPTLTGTLWWRVWSGGWFGGVSKGHQMLAHHVNIQQSGARGRDQGKHGIHLERANVGDIERILGRGKTYNLWLLDNMPKVKL